MGRNDYMQLWLWHVFHCLDVDGQVDLQQLKVVTAHVGDSLGADNKGNMSHNVEKKYQCNSTLAVCFTNYLEFLEEQGFLQNEKVNLKKLEETLWRLCLREYEMRDHKKVDSPELKQLWQIFNFLAEPGDFPVSIDREEMALLMEKLVVAMGMKWDAAHFDYVTKGLPHFSFTKTMACFESAFAKDIDKQCIAEAVREVYAEIILEVTKKGFLFKKGHMIKNWKERFFVLTPGSLAYYTDRNEKDKKGEIALSASWKAETIPDQKNYRNCFVIWTEAKQDNKMRYEMSAAEPKIRSAWMIALNAVFNRASCGGQGQYGELLKRRELRKKRREEEEEEKRLLEEKKRLKEAELRQLMLVQEKAKDDALRKMGELKKKEEKERIQRQQEEQARMEAEEKLKEEKQLREQQNIEDKERRLEDEETQRQFNEEHARQKQALMDEKAELLETVNKLQMLLDEEKRLRAEEQEARELQQRLLEEEREKRKRIEELKQQQAALLAQEQQRREDLEVRNEEQSQETQMYVAALEEEKVHLAKLEHQSAIANEKLEAAMEKISEAEKKRAIIERRKEELSKKNTSLGLAQIVKPNPKVLVTHRLVVPLPRSRTLPESQQNGNNNANNDPSTDSGIK